MREVMIKNYFINNYKKYLTHFIVIDQTVKQNSDIGQSCFFNLSFMGFPITDLFRDDLACENKKCLKGQYMCYSNSYCIDIELLCDGVSHCLYGDDEINCGENFFFF